MKQTIDRKLVCTSHLQSPVKKAKSLPLAKIISKTFQTIPFWKKSQPTRFRRQINDSEDLKFLKHHQTNFSVIWCEPVTIFHFSKIDFRQLVIELETNFEISEQISEMQIQFSTRNPKFSKAFIWLRFFLLVLAFVTSVSYLKIILKLKKNRLIVKRKSTGY